MQQISTTTPTMTAAAAARWGSIQRNASDRIALVFYEAKPDGGFTFGLCVDDREWREFAVNPDGGRAYPLDY